MAARDWSHSSGFPYSLLFNSTSAYAVAAGDTFYLDQAVEADMISDFAWGTCERAASNAVVLGCVQSDWDVQRLNRQPTYD